MKTVSEIGKGSYILIDGFPCRVVSVDLSSPGKHGSAKARITAVGIFDNTKRTLLKPSHSEIEVPEILKKRAQVVSVTGTSAQLMDTETYEMFDVTIPDDLKNEVAPGKEVEVLEAMGKKALTRVLGVA